MSRDKPLSYVLSRLPNPYLLVSAEGLLKGTRSGPPLLTVPLKVSLVSVFTHLRAVIQQGVFTNFSA